MTPRRTRLFRFTVLAALLAAGTITFAQAPAPGRETSAASVASYALASRCRSIPRSSSARCRTACATTCGRTGSRPGGPSCGWSSRPGSVLEDDDQQGLAHFVEHMQFEGTRHFPGQSINDFLVVARPEHRRGRERGDELRRHAVHAARADRRARRARSRAAGPRGLGARRHVRSGRHRTRSAPSSCRSGG